MPQRKRATQRFRTQTNVYVAIKSNDATGVRAIKRTEGLITSVNENSTPDGIFYFAPFYFPGKLNTNANSSVAVVNFTMSQSFPIISRRIPQPTRRTTVLRDQCDAKKNKRGKRYRNKHNSIFQRAIEPTVLAELSDRKLHPGPPFLISSNLFTTYRKKALPAALSEITLGVVESFFSQTLAIALVQGARRSVCDPRDRKTDAATNLSASH